MSKNEYLPFGTASGANVLTPTAYGQLASRGKGFAAGVAKSKELNTVWRQSSVIASVVAQFIANRSGDDVLDDGNLNKLQASLEKALKAKIIDSALSLYPDALTADLNTLGATDQSGVYCQPQNADATTAKHYPVNLAGTLLVTPSAYGCQQEYTEFTAGRKFQRSLTAAWNGKDGPWSAWREYYGEGHKPTATDAQAADWRNNFAARLGIARVLTGANKPTSPGVWAVENSTWTPVAWGTLYVTTNNSDLGVPSASGKYIHYLFIAHGATNKFFVATDVNGQFVGWEGYLPTKGGTLSGPVTINAKLTLSDGLELGNQKAPSPAYIDFHTDGAATDYNARIISPQGTTELNLIAADNANNGSGIVRLLGSKGDALSFALQGTARDALAWRKWGSNERPTVLELDVDGGTWLINVDHTPDNKAALGVNGVLNCEGVNVGGARMATDGNIWGTRWNPNGAWLWDAIVAQIQNVGQMSVNGTQWWAKINMNGGTLIVQGGYAEVSNAETTDRIPLNIAVPNRLLGVFITNKNFAQGYATYNPQVTVLDDNTGFNFVHGQKERMMYWIAVGY
ncbi:pyocin knob domain-containing protein [Serratia ureilytica]|uniref:Phage tail protein n=1 Tax=Serratia ureilytica TaxID=300181 RepID=A0A9X9BXB4_9GAMM|nr:pyocin knob domain-containing protein [Serratia ureilytica]TXE22163.1 hypothetical protein FOT63_25615 [Serratia ureilytica]